MSCLETNATSKQGEPPEGNTKAISITPTTLPRISLRRALAFPFTQRNWPLALAYIGAIQFVPILGYLVIRGWRFEIAKRVGANQPDALPDWRHAYEHLKQGTLLFFVTQVYFLPMYLALAWPRSGVIWAIIDLFRSLYDYYFTVIEPEPLADILYSGLRSLLLFVAILLLAPLFISPFVEAATQRYAQTGQTRTLFEFWKNFRFAFADFYDVMRIELCILVLNAVVLIVSLVLLWTVGGATFIPPVMIPVYMWTRGALMGQWIWKNRWEESSSLVPLAAPPASVNVSRNENP